VLIFVESASHEENLKRALKAAHRMRRLLAEAEDVKPKEEPAYDRTS
jgi:hypothetical protein